MMSMSTLWSQSRLKMTSTYVAAQTPAIHAEVTSSEVQICLLQVLIPLQWRGNLEDGKVAEEDKPAFQAACDWICGL